MPKAQKWPERVTSAKTECAHATCPTPAGCSRGCNHQIPITYIDIPNPPLDWRKIEAALIHGIRDMGLSTVGSCVDNRDTGDKFLEVDEESGDINLTALAQHLAEELAQ